MNTTESLAQKAAVLTVQRLKLPLAEHEKNPRQHPKQGSEEWELLRASLKDAYFDPLVWNKRNGKLVSGHLRQKVLLSEGYTHCDCVVVDWPEEQHLAKMIAANRGMGEDDQAGLRLILEDLSQSGFDLQLTGLTEDVFAAINFNPVTMAGEEQGNTPKDVLEDYENSTVRQIILIMGTEEFEQIMPCLEAIKKFDNLTNNTEAALKAIRNYADAIVAQG